MFKSEKLNILSKRRASSYESNLIFIKQFLYSIDLSLFIALICFLILLQSFLYGSNASLLFSVKAKTNCLFSFLYFYITKTKTKRNFFSSISIVNTFHYGIFHFLNNRSVFLAHILFMFSKFRAIFLIFLENNKVRFRLIFLKVM